MTEPPAHAGRAHAWAWLLCALCALLGLLLYLAQPQWPLAPGATVRQMGVWLCLLLLLGLWTQRALPPLFAVLLVLLVMNLFGLAPMASLLSGAGSDAVLWGLGVLGLAAAARESGLLGWLAAQAARSLRPAPRTPAWQRMPAVAWLALAFALLPSPRQARQWARIFQALPVGAPAARRDLACAAQLCARLAWLPAHPANLLALALLPASGLDRFVPLYWFAHTWPLALLALAYAVGVQWLAPPSGAALPAAPPPAQDAAGRAALRDTAAIALGTLCLVALQPLHGLAPGVVTLPALAALFALHVLAPRHLQTGIDWPLFVSLMVLPGLVACFAAALPSLPWSGGGALPLALLLGLRLLVPSNAAALLALVLAIPWAEAQRYDLLEALVPALAGFHLAEFLLQRHAGSTGRWRRIRATLCSPVTWLGCAAYALWCGW